jgi:hypothetical protein
LQLKHDSPEARAIMAAATTPAQSKPSFRTVRASGLIRNPDMMAEYSDSGFALTRAPE